MTLAAALLGWGLDGVEMGVFPIIARPALAELLNTPTAEDIRQWNGLLAIAFLVGAAIGGVFFGWLGDRVGRVRALALAVLTYSLLTGLAAFARTPTQLAFARFLAATGMGGEWALGVALVVETWPASARPWLAGLIGAAVNVGYVAVALLSTQFDLKTEWRSLLGFCALPALLTFVIRLFVPESSQWRTATAVGPKPRLAELFEPGLRRFTLLGAAAGGLVIFAIWGAVQFTQLWAVELSGDPAAAGRVQLVSAGAAVVGALLAPILLANVSRRLGYFMLSAAAFASAEFLFLGHSSFNTQFLIAVGVAGLCTGAFNGWLPLYLPELFPTRIRAAGQGTCYNIGRLFAAGGVWLTTVPFDFRGQSWKASAIVSLAYAGGMILAAWLPSADSTGTGAPDGPKLP